MDDGLGIYRHTDLQGFASARPPRYRAEYDIFHLGIVLLEIGLRKPSQCQLQRDRNFVPEIAGRNATPLGFAMGKTLYDSCTTMLDGRFDEVQGIECDEGNLASYNRNLRPSFFWEVVKPLGQCQA